MTTNTKFPVGQWVRILEKAEHNHRAGCEGRVLSTRGATVTVDLRDGEIVDCRAIDLKLLPPRPPSRTMQLEHITKERDELRAELERTRAERDAARAHGWVEAFDSVIMSLDIDPILKGNSSPYMRDRFADMREQWSGRPRTAEQAAKYEELEQLRRYVAGGCR